MKWLFFFLCCLGSGVVGGLVAGALTGPASVQTAETDTTQVAEGGVSLNEVDNKMLMLHNNISRYFSSKIQVLSKTVNQMQTVNNVQQSRQDNTYQLFSVNDTNIQIGFVLILVVVMVMVAACCGVCGLGHHVRHEGYWPRVRELLRRDHEGGPHEGGGVPGVAAGGVGTETSSSPSIQPPTPPPPSSPASPASSTTPASSGVPELVGHGFRRMPQWQLDDNRYRLFAGGPAGSPEWSGGSAASFSPSFSTSPASPATLWSPPRRWGATRGWQPAMEDRLATGISRLATTTIDINDGSRVDTYIHAPRTTPEDEDSFQFNSPI